MPSSQHNAAIMIGCSDPRLYEAAPQLIEQVKREMGVGLVIPLTHPGVARLRKAGRFGSDTHMATETIMLGCKIHFEAHKVVGVGVASHHGCLGCPGNNEEQEQYARLAAGFWQGLLKTRLGYNGAVRPVVFELHPNPGWKAKFLD